MKSDILLSLGKVHVENEGRFQALPPDAYFVRVTLGRSIQLLRDTHPARFQGYSRFCETAHGTRHLIADLNQEALIYTTGTYIQKH